MVFQTEKALADVGDKVDASEKATVEADIQALKDILANHNRVVEIIKNEGFEEITLFKMREPLLVCIM